MMKKNYESPLTEEITLQHQESVLQAASPYRDSGSGAKDVHVNSDDDITFWM